MNATYKSWCPACGLAIEQGSSVSRRADINMFVHANCVSTALSATHVDRLKKVASLGSKATRKIAMSLGHAVTESGRYVDNSLALWRATQCGDDAKWLSAYALATGKQVHEGAATTVVVEKKVDMSALREEALKVAREAAMEVAAGVARVEITVKVADKPAVTLKGKVHKQFAKLLKMAGAGCNVWLAGPAGSGKTTAAQQVAESLGLQFFFNGAIDTEYKLSGFVDAQGRVVSTAFRRAWTEGGVYLFDEVDASLPSATLAFNAALAGDLCDFPGDSEPVRKHADFRCIAAGNTWGMGATAEYVGRNKMDAAFLDRFVQLTWDYDEDLERSLATDQAWCATVQGLRAKAKARGLKVVISPRATVNGCRLLAAGMTKDEVIDATIRAKISAADWSNLNA